MSPRMHLYGRPPAGTASQAHRDAWAYWIEEIVLRSNDGDMTADVARELGTLAAAIRGDIPVELVNEAKP